MRVPDLSAPRALLHREMITVHLTSLELSNLIELLEARACRAAQHPEQVDFADYLFWRVAELREAFR
jgi:hypothetical protein